VRQDRIDRGQAGPRDQGLLSSERRVELNRLRKENRELRSDKDLSSWRQRPEDSVKRAAESAHFSSAIQAVFQEHPGFLTAGWRLIW
jgi:hypothetical protein